MSEFLFNKSQRVIVPADRAGAEGVQGVVTVNVARLGREPHYEVQWPATDSVQTSGDLTILCADVSETELLKAKPPRMVPAIEAEKMAQEAFAAGGDHERALIRKDREARAAKRKKPAARKRRR